MNKSITKQCMDEINQIDTGYKDREGNTIYQGNILWRESHWDTKVVWNEKQQKFMIEIIHDDPDMRLQFPLEDEAHRWEVKCE